jgi:aspartate aminotransferase-like enzyme
MNHAGFKSRLLAPGPVAVPPSVLAAMARPTIHHRSAPFTALFNRVRTALAEAALMPDDDVLVLTGSGSAAFEAGLLATVPAGASVVALHNGKFGERWAGLAARYGYEVRAVAAPWGAALDLEGLACALDEVHEPAAVLVVHSETSTGQLNDVRAVAELVRARAPEALVLDDAVTSFTVTELRPDAWGLDGIFTGSQKGLMMPPGLAFAWLSERAWSRHAAVRSQLLPSFYLDLAAERVSQRAGQTAFTTSVNLIYGLEAALELLHAEGLERVWARRERNNRALLAAGAALGCAPYARDPSPALAALRAPVGVPAPAIVEGFARRGVVVAGGHDDAKPVLFRPSVLGHADAFDVLTLAAGLEGALRDLDHGVEVGAGVTAAMRILEGA